MCVTVFVLRTLNCVIDTGEWWTLISDWHWVRVFDRPPHGFCASVDLLWGCFLSIFEHSNFQVLLNCLLLLSFYQDLLHLFCDFLVRCIHINNPYILLVCWDFHTFSTFLLGVTHISCLKIYFVWNDCSEPLLLWLIYILLFHYFTFNLFLSLEFDAFLLQAASSRLCSFTQPHDLSHFTEVVPFVEVQCLILFGIYVCADAVCPCFISPPSCAAFLLTLDHSS